MIALGRLMKKVDVWSIPGHWLWTGGVNSKGYGIAWLDGGLDTAHRQFYKLFVGPIPDGLLVCHKCDIRRCVNPDCLFLGTEKDNSADMVQKGRSARGELQPFAKLTEKTIDRIKKLRQEGLLQKDIGEAVGVGQPAISRILAGKRWNHLDNRTKTP